MNATLNRFSFLLATIPDLLKKIPIDEFEHKPDEGRWSKKEILGHLLDSATNNHHRFVRSQFEENPSIQYDQEKWNAHNYYQSCELGHLIEFWVLYNRQVLYLLKNIPAGFHQRRCDTGGRSLTIGFIAEDYVRHMEHHLKQIVKYEG